MSALMKCLGVEALYRRPNTSRKHANYKIWPYLLRNLKFERSNEVWEPNTTYVPMARGFRLSDCDGRLGKPRVLAHRGLPTVRGKLRFNHDPVLSGIVLDSKLDEFMDAHPALQLG
ncbi:MAG: hypothetical protein RXR52_31165 [Paraburkholderia sp.]